MTTQEILEAHYANLDYDGCFLSCECGWIEKDAEDRHLIHQAEVLDKRMQEREAIAFAKGQASVKRGYNAFGESFDDPANPYETESTNGR